ncbi:hypothetical protein [Arthrobacter sp. NicSoilC12]|uniref:hypothetical protein n=1 Tax=Arthrobacter sp. NicSoilC12 TaxID=2831001 RepID=UPI001CC6658D|nr:hypothetical protein [Arthrobacter sp. NicSoilC12]GIU56563.1 hypothetical protein NicSoilC12_23120 [Arthrobacter sp. NicSoilC12]
MSHRDTRQARSRVRSRIAVVVAGVALLSWAGPGANAFWAAVSNGGTAAAGADAMAASTTPSTSVSAGNVTLAWNASTTLAGRPVTGYTVARYSPGGQKGSAGGTCATQPVAGLGCIDQGVPTGTWYYTVTPVLGQWQGVESVRSAGAAVDTTPPGAPTVTAPAYLNSTTVTSVPVSGTTEAGASIALTVADAGTPAHTVTATATADSTGFWNATVNLTGLNAGTVTYRAVATDTAGNQGNPATPGTATSFKDVIAPTVSNVTLVDFAGTPKTIGKLDSKDKVTIQFSEALDASTICSSWAAAANGTLSGDNQVTVNISATNVLSVVVLGTACPTVRIGTVALGATYYGSGTLSYKGTGSNASTLNWDTASKTLTVTLGALVPGGTPSNANQQPAVPSFTPDVGIKDRAGNSLAVTAVSGSSSSF